jgi:enamine deaminase RidA (YjgF/YER057c/UK114 family)
LVIEAVSEIRWSPLRISILAFQYTLKPVVPGGQNPEKNRTVRASGPGCAMSHTRDFNNSNGWFIVRQPNNEEETMSINRIAGKSQGRCRAVVHNGLVYTVATDTTSSTNIADQTKQTLQAIQDNLEDAGSAKTHTVGSFGIVVFPPVFDDDLSFAQ